MINKFRKAFSCIIVLSMFLFTSCDSQPPLHELARKDADKIFELIKNEDIEQLSEMFSNEAKQKHNLEEEWKELFDSIDGNIVEYEKIEFGAEEEGWDKNGNLYKQSITVKLIKPKTDKGIVYDRFGYFQAMVYADNPNQEGINVFFLINADNVIQVGGIE